MGMKTAISIPDDVFADAERLAKVLKQSRSQLYSRAVREYVARHAEDQVTDALNEVFADRPTSDSEFLADAARRTFSHSDW
jgi:predicted transcriptional regulator